ncbi:endonuclease III [Candidatus Micrarchaeota archaeon]|nr:endonuclease III [Candidatus Micrarchaeota archaeon]
MDYAKVLSIMEEEGKKKKAPVYKKDCIIKTPFQALVFTMLSARARDVSTMKVCSGLFSKADSPEKILEMGENELQKTLRPIGFYREKAKRVLGTSRKLVREFGGKVPDTREELMRLPGVGRKTANIILNREFGKPAVAVDVHVHRIANRLGWVETKNPLDTENKLLELLPEKLVRRCNRAMVGYGQTVCLPRNPKCRECKLRGECKRVGLPGLD